MKKEQKTMNQWKKGIARWRVGDTLYLSVPFSWLVDEAELIAADWKGPSLIGGPGLMKPTSIDGYEPILHHNPLATFTTRGCPNQCPFCAVPLLEGYLREIPDFRPAPVVCDNNLLAASKAHIRRVIDRLKVFPYIDFNQGLDADYFTPTYADWLGELRCKVRFSFDHISDESTIRSAVELCRRRTTADIGVYCLIGYDDTPDEAIAKLELVRTWGLRPYPMRYQPTGARRKNDYLAPGWTEYDIRRIVKYYSRLRWYEHIPFDDFDLYLDELNQGVLI